MPAELGIRFSVRGGHPRSVEISGLSSQYPCGRRDSLQVFQSGKSSWLPHGCVTLPGSVGLGPTGSLPFGEAQARCECTLTTTDLVSAFQSCEGQDPIGGPFHFDGHVRLGRGGASHPRQVAISLPAAVCQGLIYSRTAAATGSFPPPPSGGGGVALPTAQSEKLAPGFPAHAQEGPKPSAAQIPQ